MKPLAPATLTTASLVNAVLDKLMEWEGRHSVPFDTLLDGDDAIPEGMTLRHAVKELNRRHTHMPISDSIREEARRKGTS